MAGSALGVIFFSKISTNFFLKKKKKFVRERNIVSIPTRVAMRVRENKLNCHATTR